MSLTFGTDNITFVPRGSVLTIWDVYHWQKIQLDVNRMYVRLRPAGYKLVRKHLEEFLEGIKRRRETRGRHEEYKTQVDDILDRLAEIDAPSGGEQTARAGVTPEGLVWWVRLSDRPAESFHQEDYEEAENFDGPFETTQSYGSIFLAELDEEEVPLPGEGVSSAFTLFAPQETGIQVVPMEGRDVLPLVHEYCGAQGVSARGNSVNLDWNAQIVREHVGCCPMRKVGQGFFATLYFFYPVTPEAEVVAPLEKRRWEPFLEAMADSGFALVEQGPTHRVFENRGYTIHAYEGLEGKESAGAAQAKPFIVVGTSNARHDPLARANILQQILDVTAP